MRRAELHRNADAVEESRCSRGEPVLQRLSDFSIILKESKCRFGVRQITYLGHTLDGEKIFIHDSKAEVFSLIQEPTNLTSLRSFVGLMNYYKNHMWQGYSSTMAPLYSKIASYGKQTKVNIALTDEQRQAFLTIKQAIVSKTLSPVGEIVLKTDASDLAFGGRVGAYFVANAARRKRSSR